MKYNINNKIVFIAAVSSLAFSGCVGKHTNRQSTFTSNHDWKVTYVKADPSMWVKKRPLASVVPINKKNVVKPVIKTGWNKNVSTVTKKEKECIDCYATDFSAKVPPKRLAQNRVVENVTNPFNNIKNSISQPLQSNSKNSYTFNYVFNPSDFNAKYEENNQYATQAPLNRYVQNSLPQSIESVREAPSRSENRVAYVEQPINTLHYGAYDYTVSKSDFIGNGRQNFKVASVPRDVYTSNGSYGMNRGASIQVGAFREYASARKVARKYNLLSSNYKVEIKTGRKDNAPIHRVRISGFNNQTAAREFMSRYGISDAFLVRR